jgi:hypothetical protein
LYVLKYFLLGGTFTTLSEAWSNAGLVVVGLSSEWKMNGSGAGFPSPS